MKRYFAILIFILWASRSWAFPPGFVDILGSGGAVDYCADKLGSYSLVWTADHPLGDMKACVSGGTVDVSAIGGTISTSQNHTVGGTKSFSFSAGNQHIRVSNNSYITSSSGYIKIWVYMPADQTTDTFDVFEYNVDTNNSIYIPIQRANNRFIIYFKSNNGGTFNDGVISNTSTLVTDGWNLIEAWWDVPTTLMGARLNSGTAVIDTAATIKEWTSEATYIYFGENIWSELPLTTYYIDDITLSADGTP